MGTTIGGQSQYSVIGGGQYGVIYGEDQVQQGGGQERMMGEPQMNATLTPTINQTTNPAWAPPVPVVIPGTVKGWGKTTLKKGKGHITNGGKPLGGQQQMNKMTQMLEQTLINQERILTRDQEVEQQTWIPSVRGELQQEIREEEQNQYGRNKGSGYNMSKKISNKPIEGYTTQQQRNIMEQNTGIVANEAVEVPYHKEGITDVSNEQLTNIIKLKVFILMHNL